MEQTFQTQPNENILSILENFFDDKQKIMNKELSLAHKKIEKEMFLAQLEAGYMFLLSDKDKDKIEKSIKKSKKMLWRQVLKKTNGDKKKAIFSYAQIYGEI